MLVKLFTSGWDSTPANTLLGALTQRGWDLIQPKPHGLPTEITDLVSGPTETLVLGVSPQRGFSERQSDN